ncbi:HTH-type transcriptional regulator BhcR [Methylobacterium radiodurans]|uniref:IclR family transcriptional regulator n=1 Tax=Methylobacterium radiodurans TaxID=2202828 RepID=A0A2U8VYI9_9HYPH|nr:HTH-type transcriptional regulator BhcR [Methylobacterium radiodurans]AWN38847.1 IclR family transcriptional regulator [Methylobacterium radiodurans]
MQKQIRRRGRPKTAAVRQPTGIQALSRALDVLEALAAHDGLTLTELAGHLGQSTATMHRVLSTLDERRYVEIDPRRQTWFVGPETFRLGSSFMRNTNIVERSRSVMRDLMSRTGETSNLGIERDGEVLFISQVETHETIRAFFPPGTKSPLHASGIGKALLSSHDDAAIEAFIASASFTVFTDKTLSNAGALRDAVARTRQCGYALDDEERTAGMRCVAASILNVHGEPLAGISVSGPTSRMPDPKIREIGGLVSEAAREISMRLGASDASGGRTFVGSCPAIT